MQGVKQTQRQKRNGQRGFSLVELMIALAIGAALIAGMIQIFTSNNAAFRSQQTVARMQENGRFAFHFLGSELRQIGYTGCAGDLDVRNVLDQSGSEDEILFDFTHSLNAWTKDNLPPDLDFGSTEPVDDSEVLLVRRAGAEKVNTEEGETANAIGDVELETPNSIETGDIVTISDCLEAAIFQYDVGTSSGDPGNTSGDLKHYFGEGSHLSRTFVTRFYVAENPEGEPALYRRVNNEDPEELVSGVERLDIRYGLDTDRTYDLPSPLPSDPECDIEDFGDGEIDEYVEASGIDDDKCEWGKVIGARISLLIRSREDDVMPDQQTVRFAGQDLNFSDGHMRHVVNSTVAFRNKLR